MTIAIPLTIQIDYSELRYSLRSIEKYLPDSEIVIITDQLPEWIVNVTHIELSDVRGRKQLSIKRKIHVALEYSNEILFSNDDIFFLKPVDKFLYYYFGELKSCSKSGAKPLYDQLIKMGKPTKNFDNHMPLIYEREKFKAVSSFTADTIIKSAYCNYNEIEGVYLPDCKLPPHPKDIKGFIKDRQYFSTGVHSLKNALPVLQELYPIPSNYEI